jgi:4-hydroxy-3-methylbut-2-en-1-yl diphosphate synthase IspG/GcpE
MIFVAYLSSQRHNMCRLSIEKYNVQTNCKSPGEMADADFGYVGSGPGKITLYRSKEVVKKNVDSEVAVDELINLLKESGAWVEPA